MVVVTLTLTEDREADLRNRLERLRAMHNADVLKFENKLKEISLNPKRSAVEANLKRDELAERGKRITLHNMLRVAAELLADMKDQELLEAVASEGIARGRPRRVSQG